MEVTQGHDGGTGMAQQYVATDTRTGFKVEITGDFPPEKDDRIRIAATTNLFTRLMATVLSTPGPEERRGLFRSLEMALEWAEAAIRQDAEAMGLIMQRFLAEAGVTQDQVEDLVRRLQEEGALPPEMMAGANPFSTMPDASLEPDPGLNPLGPPPNASPEPDPGLNPGESTDTDGGPAPDDMDTGPKPGAG